MTIAYLGIIRAGVFQRPAIRNRAATCCCSVATRGVAARTPQPAAASRPNFSHTEADEAAPALQDVPVSMSGKRVRLPRAGAN